MLAEKTTSSSAEAAWPSRNAVGKHLVSWALVFSCNLAQKLYHSIFAVSKPASASPAAQKFGMRSNAFDLSLKVDHPSARKKTFHPLQHLFNRHSILTKL